MVAHEMLGNTQAVLAHELTVITGAVVQAASSDTLIRAIGTVLVAITEPALRDTHVGAGTGEGGGATCLAFTVSCLIGAIPAIIATVTQPLLGDTPVVLALELCL